VQYTVDSTAIRRRHVRQQGSDDPASRPDFKDRTLRDVTEGVNIRIAALSLTEMLSQFWVFVWASVERPSAVDPLFLGHSTGCQPASSCQESRLGTYS